MVIRISDPLYMAGQFFTAAELTEKFDDYTTWIENFIKDDFSHLHYNIIDLEWDML